MSIIIKGMDMPHGCWECRFFNLCEGGECYCDALESYIGYTDEMPEDRRRPECPLEEGAK